MTNTLKKIFFISKPKRHSVCPLFIATLSLGIASLFWTAQANADASLEIITEIYSPCHASHPAYGNYYCGSKTNTRFSYDFDNTPGCDHCTEGCSSCQLSVPHYGWNALDNVPIHFNHDSRTINKRLVIYRKQNSCMECDLEAVN